MICCDGCENWFHGRCVGVTESMAQAIDTYFCPECQKRDKPAEAEPVDPEQAAEDAAHRAAEERARREREVREMREREQEQKELARMLREPERPSRTPSSAPATPCDPPGLFTPPGSAHAIATPASSGSRHKRKGPPMRSIKLNAHVLPPPSLPSPEVLAREAAKFKAEILTSSNPFLDFASAYRVLARV